jgi:hypothetical protein
MASKALAAPRRLPWPHWSSWIAVYDAFIALLTPSDTTAHISQLSLLDLCGEDHRLSLLRTIKSECLVWASRGHCPLAADMTGQLLGLLQQAYGLVELQPPQPAAALADSEQQRHALRLALSLAIQRLVNGFADAGQGGIFAASGEIRL